MSKLVNLDDVLDILDKCYADIELDYGRPVNCYEGMFYTRLKMTLSSLQPEPRWIPISERRPGLYERVLVTDGEDVTMSMLGKLRKDYVWLFETFWNDLEELPYWMPLPAPCKKEGD